MTPDAPLATYTRSSFRTGSCWRRHRPSQQSSVCRRRDADDIRLLAGRLGLTTAPDVFALCAEVFPAEPVPDRARRLVEEILQPQGESAD
jgi:hypothetical protein